MTIINLGSINIDHVHEVPHFPAPGETLADLSYRRGLGGKGLNQSIAAAAAGAEVLHVGAVGADGEPAVERLSAAGVDPMGIAWAGETTGHAVVYVDPTGENQIVIHAGANRAIPRTILDATLARSGPGDWFLTQNETALTREGATAARARGLKVAYAAAPFNAEAVGAMLPLTDLLILNEEEAAALEAHLGRPPDVPAVLVTLGADGARYVSAAGAVEVAAFPVAPVDTTGAGDIFAGWFVAGLDVGLETAVALHRAAAAAAISVTRFGAADSVPSMAEVDEFLTRMR